MWGGGYFLSRCPGRHGEWLALTGEVIDGGSAVEFRLADAWVASERLSELWRALGQLSRVGFDEVDALVATFSGATAAVNTQASGLIDHFFGLESVAAIVSALEADSGSWAQHTAAVLRKRSPLMLHVVLEQVRRARGLELAQDLRMERDLVRHCFYTDHLQRSGASSETVEGVRALAVDKDHAPKWNPARIEDITPAMVEPFFVSPWPAHAHPLAALR